MVTARPVTIAEFASMSREGSWELIDGELVSVTPSSDRSGWIAGEIFAVIRHHVRDHNLGWVFPPETGFVLFGDRAVVRSPDASFVCGDRLTALSDQFVPLAPDLAVEVLSPSDRMVDALSKAAMYLQAGVRLVWLVDPASLTVTVFRPDAAPMTLHSGDTLDGGAVLPGFSVPVAVLFSPISGEAT